MTPESEPSIGVAWTADGSDIVSLHGFCGGRGLWRIAAATSGKPVMLAFASDTTSAPAISRQLNRLAYAAGALDTNIYRVDLSGPSLNPGIPSKFVSSTGRERLPVYSPDGKKVLFASNRSGSWEFWVCDSDGSNAVPRTSLGGEDDDSATWSPDGRRIAFGSVVEGKRHIFVANADGGPPQILTTDPAGAMTFPSWPQDGQCIYFRSMRSGSSAIRKIPAKGGDAVRITPDGPERDMPQESPDGEFLYYVKGDRYPEECSVLRMPVSGGEEMSLINCTACHGPYAVWEQGIYFLTPIDKQGRCNLSLYDFPTSKTRTILTFEQPQPAYHALSPGGRTILY